MKREILIIALLPVLILGCVAKSKNETPAEAAPVSLADFNSFSIDLLSLAASESDTNIVVSPLSCGFALGMLYTGASGETAVKLESVFSGTGAGKDGVNAVFKQTASFLTGLDKDAEVVIANSMWYSDKIRVKQDFRTALLTGYAARIQSLAFLHPASVDVINSWVEGHTKNRITNLIDSIEPDQVAFLINALYFNGAWTKSFDETLTAPGDFYLDDGSVMKTPMMHAKDLSLLYGESDRAEVVTLSYGKTKESAEGFEFTVIMPSEEETTESLMQGMTSQALTALLENQTRVKRELYLPKFSVESELVLNALLGKLGLDIIFSDKADFSAMLDGLTSLSIDYIKQKCYIDVSEKGTEAAAATTAAVKATSVTEAKVTRINRPFVFLVREKSTGVVLFAGVIKNPEYTK